MTISPIRISLVVFATIVALGAGRAGAQVREGARTQAPRVAEAKQPPVLLNQAAVAQLLTRAYPTDLRQRRIGGTVIVELEVDTTGRPTRPRIVQSSGQSRLDDAAVEVTGAMQFRPAKVGGRPVKEYTRVPVSFRP